MTVTEQPQQNADHPTDHARPTPVGQPPPVAELLRTRLGEVALTEPVKALLKEALGDSETHETSTAGRIHLESVAVARFRGIGARAWLKLSPRPGVNLVMGRNGSGKSSIAEGIETAFTGVNMRWQGQHATRSSNWRNHHDTDGRPEIDVSVDGQEASALSVMSQGEQHSLALSLFLPRAATADSPSASSSSTTPCSPWTPPRSTDSPRSCTSSASTGRSSCSPTTPGCSGRSPARICP